MSVEHIETYLKNSNTGIVMRMVEYKTSLFKWDFEPSFYCIKNYFIGNSLCTEGFVKISKKTFELEKRKRNKNQKL